MLLDLLCLLPARDFAAAAGFDWDEDFAGTLESEVLAFFIAGALGFAFGAAGAFAGFSAEDGRGGVTDVAFAGLAGTADRVFFGTSILFAASRGGADAGSRVGRAVSSTGALRFS